MEVLLFDLQDGNLANVSPKIHDLLDQTRTYFTRACFSLEHLMLKHELHTK